MNDKVWWGLVGANIVINFIMYPFVDALIANTIILVGFWWITQSTD